MNRRIRNQAALLVCAIALTGWACSSAISQKPSGVSSAGQELEKLPDVWRSLTTGKEYYVRTDKTHLYAQWVNLPPEAKQHGAYIHTACKLEGSKYAGTSEIYMPCMVGEGKDGKIANTCRLTLGIEINSVSNSRITGRGQTLKKFNCGACKVIEAGWADFEWVPAK